jgi:Flp pilus assembly pilin Flp
LIALAAVGGFSALGGSVEDLFVYWSEKVVEALQKIP